MTQHFPAPVEASFIRILPVEWHGRISMRFELIGCSEGKIIVLSTVICQLRSVVESPMLLHLAFVFVCFALIFYFHTSIMCSLKVIFLFLFQNLHVVDLAPLVPIHGNVTCESCTACLRCNSGETVSVISALYGRQTDSLCRHESIRTTDCSAEGVLDVVQQRCDGLEICSVPASNEIFGDPCHRTYKYLNIRYTCEGKLKSMCQ